MPKNLNLKQLAKDLARHPSVLEKVFISKTYKHAEGQSKDIKIGDDCAAILDPISGGHILFAAEGMISSFVEQDPWFAGYSSIMVNISDVVAMGGKPIAITDVLWCSDHDEDMVNEIWMGMCAASQDYSVPIVGGHTTKNIEKTEKVYLAASVLGRAGSKLLTSFEAEAGDQLVMVLDTDGAFRREKPFWNSSTSSSPKKLQKIISIFPELAHRGLCKAAKDISNGGIIGTLAMFSKCSKLGAILDLDSLFIPKETNWLKWLISFPSFGYLLALKGNDLKEVQTLFSDQESIFVDSIGKFKKQPGISIAHKGISIALDFGEYENKEIG